MQADVGFGIASVERLLVLFIVRKLPFRSRPETDKTTAVVAVAIEGTLGVEDLAFRRLNLAEIGRSAF